MGGQEQRHQTPSQGVVEVVHEPRLRAGAKSGAAVCGFRERAPKPWSVEVRRRRMSCLFDLYVSARVPREEKRDRERQSRDEKAGDHDHIASGKLCSQQAGGRRRKRDSTVTGCLVQPECEPTLARANQVDLHHDGHRPGQSLIDAEQGVRGDDHAPTLCNSYQQRHRQGQEPAHDEQAPSPCALRECSSTEIRERLREAKRDEEGQHGRI